MNQQAGKTGAKGDAPPPESPNKPPFSADHPSHPIEGVPPEKPDPGKPGPRGVKMWHPEADCHIALTNGETMIVPHDKAGIAVTARFRPTAIAKGCLPVGMEPEGEEEPTGFDRKKQIKAGLKKMLDSDEDGLFTGDGKPNTTKLSARVGFTVERSEANAAWAEMEKGDDDGDEVISNEGKTKK
jgi:hypothetical protein